MSIISYVQHQFIFALSLYDIFCKIQFQLHKKIRNKSTTFNLYHTRAHYKPTNSSRGLR
jgi:hypothetical protein